MPALLDTETRTGVLVWAINDILVNEGIEALALRRVARVSGVSTSSMLHHFGSREHLFRVAAHRTGLERLAHIRPRHVDEGIIAFVPVDDRERSIACAWLVWHELSRCEPAWQRTVNELRTSEQGLVARALSIAWQHPDVVGTMAMIDGLVTAMCRPVGPLTPEDARRCLADHQARLGTATPET